MPQALLSLVQQAVASGYQDQDIAAAYEVFRPRRE